MQKSACQRSEDPTDERHEHNADGSTREDVVSFMEAVQRLCPLETGPNRGMGR